MEHWAPAAPKALLFRISSLCCGLTPFAPAVLGLRRATRGPVWASGQWTGVSPSPLVVTCLSLSSFHLRFLHSFSFPHSRFLLFSNLLFLFFCPWLPVPSSSPASFICPTAHFLPCHTALLSFLLLLLTLYYSATSFSTPAAVAAPCLTSPSTVQKSFSALQQCSSSLPCYKLTYFSLLLCYFSHLSLHPCCPFK